MIKKRRKNKTVYKEISFKLSSRQKKSLMNYCRARHTTPIKLIKKSIRNYIELYADAAPEPIPMPNQLDLFDDPS
ncbi:MAG: hypothetical protein EOL88_06300 [Bacteroidia bacterium]|jgi:hypothetical protein|nr:hypothetical protein [Bacteroidales bacterium]NCD41687.1 hypothetical protein [Bacteroidia bacterium]MDD2322544.1 hypothetical protein [Bacteroidales bacterium]MDD3009822.1 hypothetical protein [Bacteroidales bacterium]MDD3961371.1 hypothetical protein [Bacteroidales bacterium]